MVFDTDLTFGSYITKSLLASDLIWGWHVFCFEVLCVDVVFNLKEIPMIKDQQKPNQDSKRQDANLESEEFTRERNMQRDPARREVPEDDVEDTTAHRRSAERPESKDQPERL
jgi:hypothetical protein